MKLLNDIKSNVEKKQTIIKISFPKRIFTFTVLLYFVSVCTTLIYMKLSLKNVKNFVIPVYWTKSFYPVTNILLTHDKCKKLNKQKNTDKISSTQNVNIKVSIKIYFF